MSKLNFIHVFVAIILMTCFANVEGLDLPALKTAYKDFFDTLDTICGMYPDVQQARSDYNAFANQAAIYQDLINCARTAYNIYDPYVKNRLATGNYHETILSLRTTFLQAILAATRDETDAGLRIIPIPAFLATSAGRATTIKMQKQSNSQERY